MQYQNHPSFFIEMNSVLLCVSTLLVNTVFFVSVVHVNQKRNSRNLNSGRRTSPKKMAKVSCSLKYVAHFVVNLKKNMDRVYVGKSAMFKT